MAFILEPSQKMVYNWIMVSIRILVKLITVIAFIRISIFSLLPLNLTNCKRKNRIVKIASSCTPDLNHWLGRKCSVYKHCRFMRSNTPKFLKIIIIDRTINALPSSTNIFSCSVTVSLPNTPWLAFYINLQVDYIQHFRDDTNKEGTIKAVQ